MLTLCFAIFTNLPLFHSIPPDLGFYEHLSPPVIALPVTLHLGSKPFPIEGVLRSSALELIFGIEHGFVSSKALLYSDDLLGVCPGRCLFQE